MLSKFQGRSEKKPSLLSNLMNGRKYISHAEGMSKTEEERVVKLMEALRIEKDNRPLDVDTFVKFGLAKCEETIGTADFQKVKKHFGIGYKNPQKNVGKPGEITVLIAKMRTIENSMYYISGMKEVIEAIASKLLCAPEDMDMLTRAKLVILYYRVFFNHEQFVEDYINTFDPITKQKAVKYSEAQALAINNKVISPEELFVLYMNKVSSVSGIYFDAILFEIARCAKREQGEMLELGEIGFDRETEKFFSVNKCMVSPTFAKIRLLKKKVSDPRPYFVMECFANKDLIADRMDAVGLYNIYKMFHLTPWKERGEKVVQKIRTLSGSVFVDKEQEYHVVMQNLYIADDIEARRWMFLFEYLCKRECIMGTDIDGTGVKLDEPKLYNMGALLGALNFGYYQEYIGTWSTVAQDFTFVDRVLALLDGMAEEVFVEFNRGNISKEEVLERLGVDKAYAKENFQMMPEIQEIMNQIRKAEDAIKAKEAEEPAEEEISQEVKEDVIPEPEVKEEVKPDVEVKVFNLKANDGGNFVIKLPHMEYESTMDFSMAPYVPENLDELPEINGYTARANYMMIESLIRHAMECGYITYPDEIALDVMLNVIVQHYQQSIMDYRSGSIGGWGLEHRCGIPEELAEGFFNLKALDIKKVEEKLMELKNNRHASKGQKAYKDNSGLIRLYCYVIENGIPCGAKMKAPKRNSSLKPKNLLALIA